MSIAATVSIVVLRDAHVSVRALTPTAFLSACRTQGGEHIHHHAFADPATRDHFGDGVLIARDPVNAVDATPVFAATL